MDLSIFCYVFGGGLLAGALWRFVPPLLMLWRIRRVLRMVDQARDELVDLPRFTRDSLKVEDRVVEEGGSK